jgi:hypothetical protein
MEPFPCRVTLTMRRSRAEIISEAKNVKFSVSRSQNNQNKQRLVENIQKNAEILKKSHDLNRFERDCIEKIEYFSGILMNVESLPKWRVLDRSVN